MAVSVAGRKARVRRKVRWRMVGVGDDRGMRTEEWEAENGKGEGDWS